MSEPIASVHHETTQALTIQEEESPAPATRRGKKDQEGTMEEDQASRPEPDDEPKPVVAPAPRQGFGALLRCIFDTVKYLVSWISGCRFLFQLAFDIGTYLIQSFTLSNMVKLFILSLIFPMGQNKPDGSTSDVYQPPRQQHFVLEPVGYVSSSLLIKPVQSKNPGKSQTKQVQDGYYGKDKMALRQALASIPAYVQPLKLEATSATCDASQPITGDSNQSFIDGLEEGGCVSPGLGATKAGSAPLTTIVLDMKLHADPSKDISFISNAVTFLIGHARESRRDLEVVVLLYSAGGLVHSYGFVAEQLRRLREEPGITLTISCDRMALSGGYMVAAMATPGHLLASPFAQVGSIGVVMNGGLDLQEAFEKFGIKEIQVKSGDRKPRTTALGGLADEELQHMQDRSDRTHKAFREYVERWRGDAITDLDFVASGDFWLGQEALKLGLVDKLVTSDQYLDEKVKNGNKVLKLKEHKTNLFGKNKGVLLTVLDLILPPQEQLEPGNSQAAIGQPEYIMFRLLSLLHQVLKDSASERKHH